MMIRYAKRKHRGNSQVGPRCPLPATSAGRPWCYTWHRTQPTDCFLSHRIPSLSCTDMVGHQAAKSHVRRDDECNAQSQRPGRIIYSAIAQPDTGQRVDVSRWTRATAGAKGDGGHGMAFRSRVCNVEGNRLVECAYKTWAFKSNNTMKGSSNSNAVSI